MLYNTRGEVPEGDHIVPIGPARVVTQGADITIVAWSWMTVEATAAAAAEALAGTTAETSVV